jgi:hypothetical protein
MSENLFAMFAPETRSRLEVMLDNGDGVTPGKSLMAAEECLAVTPYPPGCDLTPALPYVKDAGGAPAGDGPAVGWVSDAGTRLMRKWKMKQIAHGLWRGPHVLEAPEWTPPSVGLALVVGRPKKYAPEWGTNCRYFNDAAKFALAIIKSDVPAAAFIDLGTWRGPSGQADPAPRGCLHIWDWDAGEEGAYGYERWSGLVRGTPVTLENERTLALLLGDLLWQGAKLFVKPGPKGTPPTPADPRRTGGVFQMDQLAPVKGGWKPVDFGAMHDATGEHRYDDGVWLTWEEPAVDWKTQAIPFSVQCPFFGQDERVEHGHGESQAFREWKAATFRRAFPSQQRKNRGEELPRVPKAYNLVKGDAVKKLEEAAWDNHRSDVQCKGMTFDKVRRSYWTHMVEGVRWGDEVRSVPYVDTLYGEAGQLVRLWLKATAFEEKEVREESEDSAEAMVARDGALEKTPRSWWDFSAYLRTEGGRWGYEGGKEVLLRETDDGVEADLVPRATGNYRPDVDDEDDGGMPFDPSIEAYQDMCDRLLRRSGVLALFDDEVWTRGEDKKPQRQGAWKLRPLPAGEAEGEADGTEAIRRLLVLVSDVEAYADRCVRAAELNSREMLEEVQSEVDLLSHAWQKAATQVWPHVGQAYRSLYEEAVASLDARAEDARRWVAGGFVEGRAQSLAEVNDGLTEEQWVGCARLGLKPTVLRRAKKLGAEVPAGVLREAEKVAKDLNMDGVAAVRIEEHRREFWRRAKRALREVRREVRMDKKVRRMAWVLDGSDAYRSRAGLPLNPEKTPEEIGGLVVKTELTDRLRERVAGKRKERNYRNWLRSARTCQARNELAAWRWQQYAHRFETGEFYRSLLTSNWHRPEWDRSNPE